MKFNFSLDPVLKVRKHQEKMQKLKLANEVLKKNQISELQSQIKKKLENYISESSVKNPECIHNIKIHSSYLHEVHTTKNELDIEEAKADEAVTDERLKLHKAHKKRHILEKVKEFEYSLFSEKVSRNEQNVLDEIAAQSFSR